jgi:hypothetical protein
MPREEIPMHPDPRGGGRARPGSAAQPSPQTLQVVRDNVRDMLLHSDAFRALAPDVQREIASHTVQVCTYLAEPEGIRADHLSASQQPTSQASGQRDAYALGLGLGDRQGTPRRSSTTTGGPATPQFTAQAAREGAAVAGALLQQVNFPDFVAGLINGVFHSIVSSSIEQMEAYGKLVADVAKTLNQFRDENVSVNQGRDHLIEQYPDVFQLNVDTGEDGNSMPRVTVREGVDERTALARVNSMPVEGGAVTNLEDETIEGKLVPAARTQLATSRQQLLATMVLMGINRIVVQDGRISAKVMYDFQARDNFKYRASATQFDYADQYKYASEGTYDQGKEGGESSSSGKYKSGEGNYESTSRGASYYSKGEYKNSAEPMLKLASATQTSVDASLQTKASLAGQVEVNFKSDYLPLEKMADSFQIGRIQEAAKPGPAQPVRTTGAGGGTTAPATPPAGQTPINR